MIKKLIILLLVSILCLCGFGMSCDCEGIGLRLYENEYFIYTLSYERDEASILGLTDKGREQEYLVIPEMIEGMKVVSLQYFEYTTNKIANKYGDKKYSGMNSDKLKKVFVLPEVRVYNQEFFKVATNEVSVLYIFKNIEVQENINHYEYYYTKDNALEVGGIRNHKANVSYFYNYENSPNDGYYWIDNYGYGETIQYIPQSPTRDGYTFGGWYKEPECINTWDFTTDTIPQVQYDENEKEIYQETKLYAKWTMN